MSADGEGIRRRRAALNSSISLGYFPASRAVAFNIFILWAGKHIQNRYNVIMESKQNKIMTNVCNAKVRIAT